MVITFMVGILVPFMALLGCCCWCWRRRRRSAFVDAEARAVANLAWRFVVSRWVSRSCLVRDLVWDWDSVRSEEVVEWDLI